MCVCFLSLCNAHNFKWNWNGNNMWISIAITLFFFTFICSFVYLYFQWATIHLVFWCAFGNLSALYLFSDTRVFHWFQGHTGATFLSPWPGIIRKHVHKFSGCVQCAWLFFALVFNCIFVCLFVWLFFVCFFSSNASRGMCVCLCKHIYVSKRCIFFVRKNITEKRINTRRTEYNSCGQSQERILSLLFSE